MAVAAGSTEVNVTSFGGYRDVHDDPKAKLMYYLDCLCYVLDLEREPNLRKLRDHAHPERLTEAETDALVSLCFLLSPDELSGKVIFQDDDMCRGGLNNFYRLDAVSRNIVVSESVVIGGERRRVKKIMAFTRYWLKESWVDPMTHFAPRLARIAAGVPSVPQPRQARSANVQPRQTPAQQQREAPAQQPRQAPAQQQQQQRPRSSSSGCSIQ